MNLIPCLLQKSITEKRIENYIKFEYCKKSLRFSFVLLLIYNTNYKGYIIVWVVLVWIYLKQKKHIHSQLDC